MSEYDIGKDIKVLEARIERIEAILSEIIKQSTKKNEPTSATAV